MNNLNKNLASLVMVQGVSANAGKSVITKSLGRYYANLGYNVTTFKPVQVCLDKVVSNGVVTDIRMGASLKACRQPVSQHNNPNVLNVVDLSVVLYGVISLFFTVGAIFGAWISK